jgi:CubicO group peptidase (beta-lactamase class C family)
VVDVGALRQLVVEEQERFGVPGLALALVADGEVLLCEGFGLRDVEGAEPVTADTHFPLASDSKAFTAALLCGLADAGRLDLDQPVRDIMPWFALRDPHASALASTRDLLSHRTGLPRHDFLWYGAEGLTLEGVARALRHLEPNKPFRQTWQYNNLCFLTAGHVTEVVTGTSWEQTLQERLLAPLAMHATVLSRHDPAVAALALPYRDARGELVRAAVPSGHEVGPAGGIVSTARDLSSWLLARLGHRPDVLSAGALAQLHAPAMIGGVGMAAFDERQPMGYALGCQVESYRGTRVVRHGGNLMGYSSDVTVAPGAGIGIAILTNLHLTGLRDALPLTLLDRLLGLAPAPWGERYHAMSSALLQGRAEVSDRHAAQAGGTRSARDLDEYVGSYTHPAYGRLEVRRDGNRLLPRLNSLGDLLRLDHRHHDTFDLFDVEFELATPVTFTQDANGEIDGLTARLEPQVAPIVFGKVPPEPEPGLSEALLGTYRLGPHSVVVRTRGDDLVASVPTAGELVLASTGGRRFRCPAVPGVAVEAVRDETGQVGRLVVEPVGVFERAD